jgi:hypothetical protein
VTPNVMRATVAFLVTPVFAVFFIPASACVVSLFGSGSCDVDFGWTPVFAGVAYAATAIAGMPLYFALRRFGLRRWWYFGFAGVIVGLVAATIVKFLDSGFAWSGLAIVVTPVGFMTGVLFLWISNANRHESVRS